MSMTKTKANRRWAKRDRGRAHALYVRLFGRECLILILRPAKTAGCWTVENKSMDGCQVSDIISESLEDAKLVAENMFRDYLLKRRDFYDRVLDDYDKDSEN